jgi:hypothetical protein
MLPARMRNAGKLILLSIRFLRLWGSAGSRGRCLLEEEAAQRGFLVVREDLFQLRLLLGFQSFHLLVQPSILVRKLASVA